MFDMKNVSKINLFYTFLSLINHFSYGMTISLIGATLVDLAFIYNVSIDTASYLTMACGLGYLLGAVTPWFYRWLNRQLTVTFNLAMMAVTILLVPYLSNFYVAFALFTFNGIGAGAWDAASGFWIVEMWPVGNSGMLQLLQFSFGAGTIAGPVVAAPFVRGELLTYENRTITIDDRKSLLKIPYAINAILGIIVPIIFFILYFVNRYQYKETSNEKKVDINANFDEPPLKRVPFRRTKLAVLCICLSVYNAAEVGWWNFSPSLYQYLEIKLDATTSAHVMTILTLTYTIGRFVTAFITIKLKPDLIISYHYLIIYSGLLLILFGRDNLTLICIGTGIIGFGFSAMWPAIFAIAERHLRLSTQVCAVYSFVVGGVSLIIPLIMGSTFHAHPMILFVLVGLFLTVSLIMYIIVLAWIHVDNRRLKREKN